ncbi:MAG: Na+/H+ antiporter subunit E [Candidatus Competibacterales bacterium]
METNLSQKLPQALGSVAVTGLLGLLWWSMTAGQVWGFGAVAVALAVATTGRLGWPSKDFGKRLWAALCFGGLFLWLSLSAGVAVAHQALRAKPDFRPRWRHYPLDWPDHHPGRTLLMATITLLPGTFTADWDAAGLVIHDLGLPGTLPLEGQPASDADIHQLARAIAALFTDIEAPGP